MMTQVNGTQENALASLGLSQTTESNKAKELGSDEFMELFVAQLKNQNPLDPQQSGEFLTAMAQFGTVDGIRHMQESLASLESSWQSNQALQASALVGRSVLVPASSAQHAEGQSMKGAIELPSSVAGLKVTIENAAGEVVRTMDLGTQPAGSHAFTWDGLKDNGQAAISGEYKVKAQALQDGKNTSFTTYVQANVDSVTISKNGQPLQLNVAGIGAVGLDQIKAIN
jgi:flagellar basal-body rod modification protein FlgD